MILSYFIWENLNLFSSLAKHGYLSKLKWKHRNVHLLQASPAWSRKASRDKDRQQTRSHWNLWTPSDSISTPSIHHPPTPPRNNSQEGPLQRRQHWSNQNLTAAAAMASLGANSHGRVLHTCTLSPKPVTALSRSMAAIPGHHVFQSPRARIAVRASTERATWLPGLDPPPHLDGTSVTWKSVIVFFCSVSDDGSRLISKSAFL